MFVIPLIGFVPLLASRWWANDDLGWWLVNTLMAYLLLYASLLPHELGHFLGARLMGMRVLMIRFGKGKTVGQWQVRGTVIHLKALPFTGNVNAVPRSYRWARCRNFCFTAAGPLVNALLLAVGILGNGSEGWFGSAWAEGLAFWQALAIANGFMLAKSVFSHDFDDDGQVMWSDGKILLSSLKADPVSFRKQCLIVEGHHAMELGRGEEAGDCFRKALVDYPDDPYMKCYLAIALIMQRNNRAARQILSELAAESHQDAPSDLRASILTHLAWADLILAEKSLLDEAGRASAQAMEIAPRNPLVCGTRGIVLVACNQIEEGIKLLDEAIAGHAMLAHKGTLEAFLALGEWRAGRLQSAQEWLDRAKQHDPNDDAMAFVEREIGRADRAGLTLVQQQ